MPKAQNAPDGLNHGAGETLPITNTIRQYGNCIRLANNSVVIRSTACPCNAESVCGYYTVSVNTTLTASAAGTVTVSLYQLKVTFRKTGAVIADKM